MSSGGVSGVTNAGQGSFTQDEARQIAAENEQGLLEKLRISNKFPKDNQRGKQFDFTISNGRIFLCNGIRIVDFVIDENGKLHLGRGHSYLANGGNVIAAGEMKVDKKGNIRYIKNSSGHYQPSVVEAARYPEAFRKIGINVENAWIRIFRFSVSKSGYVMLGETKEVYNGPVKYLRRRLK